ncbi:MAG: hypothetical protein U0M02_13940 [Acutalibacteraceae bacterium]|nr:hypothetical protein [Acutalibacteraceae bacterium]
MSTCKDCLHYEVCECEDCLIRVPEWVNKVEDFCGFFKPKADYVEVVPCVECKYKDDCARQMVHTTRDYVLEQNISTYNKVDFCSYGERKESEVRE